MKKVLALLVSMFLVTSSAYAKMCPKLWAQFDVDVKTTKASAADEVTKNILTNSTSTFFILLTVKLICLNLLSVLLTARNDKSSTL